MGFDEVVVRASIEFRLKVPPLNLVDLSGTGALDLGAPTDAAHARNHAAGRALARALYDQHAGMGRTDPVRLRSCFSPVWPETQEERCRS